MIPNATAQPSTPATVRPVARTPRLLAIGSGKGGVGKTWFAITLAHALARRGRRVLLFDADLGLANVDIQLGILPPHDLGAIVAGRASIRDATLRHEEGGFDIVAGRSGSGALASLDMAVVERILTSVRRDAGDYDLTLLDLGAGLDRAARRLAAAADRLLVIATQEPTSLTDAYAVLKLHAADRGGGDAQIVVNQATTYGAGTQTYTALENACATFLKFSPRLAGIVRRDDRVREAIRRQALLLTRHPTSSAGADVEALARQVACSEHGR